MKNNLFVKILLASLGFSVLAPALALAQVDASANADAAVTPTSAALGVRAKVTASTTAETARAARAKDKAGQEIDRRIASLNALSARIDEMKKVTDTLKSNLKQNVELEITGFTNLKSKIDADADLATLKTDVQSITQSYRIYMLVLPQVRISAAADRMANVISMMNGLGVKLQARVNTAKAAGGDTASVEAALNDLGNLLTSAQAHAAAAINGVVSLSPDNGDKTVMASNDAAIKSAQAEIKAGTQDLVSARKDIATIVAGLGKFNASASASTTVSAQ